MKKLWTDRGWDDYEYWQANDKKTLKRINQILKSIDRTGYGGLGKPEPLRGNLSGWWSRRIDDTHRIVYRLTDSETIEISQCRGHYNDK
jgi:toxin YoeB